MMTENNLIIVSKRQKKYQEKLVSMDYLLIDVTSSSDDPTFRKFSPFYPHGNIPVTGSKCVAQSVEGVWQGLKVFEKESVDETKFVIKSMRNIKRVAGDKRGKVLGHMLDGVLIDYLQARNEIYIPTYQFVLDKYLSNELTLLKELLLENNKIALLDFDINENVHDLSKPLSHASLIKRKLEFLMSQMNM